MSFIELYHNKYSIKISISTRIKEYIILKKKYESLCFKNMNHRRN